MTATSTSKAEPPLAHPSWRFPPEVPQLLNPFQREFCRLEYYRPLDFYVRRCQAVGLAGLGTVVDAGCGMGQWSIALSLLNRSVQAVDVDSVRLLTANRVAAALGRDNVAFMNGSLHALPLADDEADALICYSVIMFADLDLALREIRRVLRPGGRFLVMVDLWRWHWSRVRSGHLHPIEFVKMVVKRMIGRRRGMLFGRRFFLERLRAHGFDVQQAGTEGTVGFGQNPPGGELVFFPEPDPLRSRLLEVAAYCRK